MFPLFSYIDRIVSRIEDRYISLWTLIRGTLGYDQLTIFKERIVLRINNMAVGVGIIGGGGQLLFTFPERVLELTTMCQAYLPEKSTLYAHLDDLDAPS